MSESIGLGSTEVLAGISVEIKADDSRLKQDFSRIKSDVEAQGKAMICRVPVIIDSGQVRAQLDSAIRSASSGLVIRIPVMLDGSGLAGQMASLPRFASVPQLALPGGGGGGTGGGGANFFTGSPGSRWVNSTVIGTNTPGAGGGGGGGGNGGGGSGGGGAGGGGGNSFFSRGFGRMVGAGYLVHVGFAALASERQYNIDTMLAGSDQRALVEAQFAQRQRVIGVGGWIGEAVGYLQDPSGSAEIGIRATTASASAQDAKSAAMSGRATTARDYARRAALAGDTDPYRRSVLQARFTHDDAILSIQGDRNAADKLNDAEIQARQTLLHGTQMQRARDMAGPLASYSDIQTALHKINEGDNAEIAGMRTQRSEGTRRQFDANTASANREYALALGQADRERTTEVRAAMREQTAIIASGQVAQLRAVGATSAASRQSIVNDVSNRIGAASDELDALHASGASRYRIDAAANRLSAITGAGNAELDAFDTINARERSQGIRASVSRIRSIGLRTNRQSLDASLGDIDEEYDRRQDEADKSPGTAQSRGLIEIERAVRKGQVRADFARNASENVALYAGSAAAARFRIQQRPLEATLAQFGTSAAVAMGRIEDPGERAAAGGNAIAQVGSIRADYGRGIQSQRIELGARQEAAGLIMDHSASRGIQGDRASIVMMGAALRQQILAAPAELKDQIRKTAHMELAARGDDLLRIDQGATADEIRFGSQIIGDPLGLKGETLRRQLIGRQLDKEHGLLDADGVPTGNGTGAAAEAIYKPIVDWLEKIFGAIAPPGTFQ